MEPKIEQRLVKNAKTDSAAFSELYEYYFPKIFAYVSYRVKRNEYAEDIVSLTFTKALEKIGSYSYRGLPFSAWLFRIAHNNIVDFYRKNGSVQMVGLDQAPEFRANGRTPQEYVESKEQAQMLRELLLELPLESQNLLSLKFGAGMSNRDIARTLDMPEGTVGSKIFRALRVLKQLLSDEESCQKTHNSTN